MDGITKPELGSPDDFEKLLSSELDTSLSGAQSGNAGTDEEPKKEKRGRKKGSKNKTTQEQSQDTLSVEQISSLARVPFSIVGRIRDCDTWDLTDKEANDLAVGLKPAIDKYLPQVGDYFPIVMAISSFGAIVFAKIKQEREYFNSQVKTESKPTEIISIDTIK